MKTLRHLLEAVLFKLLFTALRVLPLDVASAVGSFMALAVGPYLSAHQTARRNLAFAFPDMTKEERRLTLLNMWDNLGRTAAEFPHLDSEAIFRRVRIAGAEHFPPPGQPALFFSGHLGNWELTCPVAARHGLDITVIYRHINNPYVNKRVNDLRSGHAADTIPKGPKGSVKMLRAIKDRQSLAMLVDQKMNEGIAVPFFGRDAMTAPAIAELALRYNMPIIPTRIIRKQGCHFEAHAYPALEYEKTGDQEKDVLAIMTAINQLLESWIREQPSQWFWVHKRWPGG